MTTTQRARLADLRRQSKEHFRRGADYDGHNRRPGTSNDTQRWRKWRRRAKAQTRAWLG